MAVTRDQVAKLYVANFNRAPDAAGLDYWISDGTSATTTLTDLNAIAASMQAGAEASTGVASMTNSEYVISLYSSMFGRTVAADSADVAYWTNDITLGNVTRANMIQTLILGAEASTGSATDATVLANKTTVGLAYADAGLNGTFSVATVTDDTATVTAAEAAIYNTANPAQTLTLTTGFDNLAGGAGNDTIVGLLSGALATGSTAQPGDTINGGAGTDAFNLYVSGTAGAAFTLSGITLNNVETVGVSNFDSDAGATTIDMSTVFGATTAGLIGSAATGDTIFENMAS
ncbi:MAG: DUF4214 domain-containing protein, partial [Sulfurimonas sp.]|nr:DUF4214 domain-containing protein [Sulfurimonas sp.]